MAIDVFREELPVRRWRQMTVIGQDPSVRAADGAVLTALVRVPDERLDPGPRGHRFQVVDFDAGTGTLREPVDLGPETDLPVPKDLRSLAADNGFHAQNVYAIAARTLGVFESSLGRRVPWGFSGHQLYLVPHAFQEANAFYAEDDGALYFGYFDAAEGGTIFTCLSHDIVAHETTHALLDGLRDRYDTPGLPDQAAFHEAFADITALLSTFGLPAVVEKLIGETDAAGRISRSAVDQARLAAALGSLAEEVGRSVYGHAAKGLRNSFELVEHPPDWRRDPEFEEPHRRGEVLVAAVMSSLLSIWRRRLEPLIQADRLDRGRAAEEGARAAGHLLKMCIRSLDWCPPLEFEYEDFLDAVLVSDEEVEPDDKHDYRGALRAAFGLFGIAQPETRIIDLTGSGERLRYEGFNYTRLRADADEVYRFIWQNDVTIGIERGFHTEVERVRQVMRVGADGFVVSEAMVDYVQMLQGTPAQLARELGFPLPAALPADKEVRVFGGGVLVFDQFGRAKYHQRKPLRDERRQTARLDFLVRSGRTDSRGRFGFSERVPRGQRFAELHRPSRGAAETW